MTAWELIGAIGGVVLFGYLCYALWRPEDLQ